MGHIVANFVYAWVAYRVIRFAIGAAMDAAMKSTKHEEMQQRRAW